MKAGGIADHLKLSLLFYILLDCSAAQVEKGRGLLEDRIAQKFYLPGSYELFMKGLWYMDRGDFNVSVWLLLTFWDLANLFIIDCFTISYASFTRTDPRRRDSRDSGSILQPR